MLLLGKVLRCRHLPVERKKLKNSAVRRPGPAEHTHAAMEGWFFVLCFARKNAWLIIEIHLTSLLFFGLQIHLNGSSKAIILGKVRDSILRKPMKWQSKCCFRTKTPELLLGEKGKQLHHFKQIHLQIFAYPTLENIFQERKTG